ncbi:MAG: hypothetical protein HGA45_41870 [Chloroflexales bacterium]|nr:hypothetical protein [Chloroflexales bacterium]
MNVPDQAVDAALAAVGLPNLKVVANPGAVADFAKRPGCTITFAEALRLALEAFIGDGRGSPGQGHDSAHDIVRDSPESFGLGPGPDAATIGEALRRMLADDPSARVVLLTRVTVAQREYRFLPEYGETITDNWVFRIVAPRQWPFLQWAIVDLRGETPPYSYGFD